MRESAGPEVVLQHTTIARVKVEPVSSRKKGTKTWAKVHVCPKMFGPFAHAFALRKNATQ